MSLSFRCRGHTEVVLTPQSSNFSKVGVGAFGVSMNSKSLSEPLTLWVLDAIVPVESQLSTNEAWNRNIWDRGELGEVAN